MLTPIIIFSDSQRGKLQGGKSCLLVYLNSLACLCTPGWDGRSSSSTRTPPTWSQMTAEIWYLQLSITSSGRGRKNLIGDWQWIGIKGLDPYQHSKTCRITGKIKGSLAIATCASSCHLFSLQWVYTCLLCRFIISLKFEKQNFTASLRELSQCCSPNDSNGKYSHCKSHISHAFVPNAARATILISLKQHFPQLSRFARFKVNFGN